MIGDINYNAGISAKLQNLGSSLELLESGEQDICEELKLIYLEAVQHLYGITYTVSPM